jgi:hypothetical protein
MTEKKLNKKLGAIRREIKRTKRNLRQHWTQGREQALDSFEKALRKWEIIRYYLYPKVEYDTGHSISVRELRLILDKL